VFKLSFDRNGLACHHLSRARLFRSPVPSRAKETPVVDYSRLLFFKHQDFSWAQRARLCLCKLHLQVLYIALLYVQALSIPSTPRGKSVCRLDSIC
jgi:hypothetical protein